MNFCPNCGGKLIEGVYLCPQCNVDVRGSLPPPMPGTPAKTSGLAVAALILGILGMCSGGLTSIIGVIMGITALVKIDRSNGALGGQGLAIGGIAVGGVTFIMGLGMGAAIVIPQFLKFQSKAKQSEAKVSLGAVFTSEIAYFGENGAYADNFRDIAWSPEGVSHYAYFLPGQVI